jgi:hypothetical protein
MMILSIIFIIRYCEIKKNVDIFDISILKPKFLYFRKVFLKCSCLKYKWLWFNLSILKNLKKHNINLEKMVRQGYDEATAMIGH